MARVLFSSLIMLHKVFCDNWAGKGSVHFYSLNKLHKCPNPVGKTLELLKKGTTTNAASASSDILEQANEETYKLWM